MHWIETVSHSSEGSVIFYGKTATGESFCFSPEQFPHSPSNTGLTKLRLQVSSAGHRVTTTDDYLNEMGWSFQGGAQRLHRFKTDALEVWIPSQAMFKLLFSSAVSFYRLLFTARSPSELAVLSAEGLSLLPGWTNSSDGWGDNDSRKERLLWLMSSASASRSWRQVFRNSLDGMLDAPLPSGDFEILLSGKRRGSLFLATDARLAKVFSTDLHRPSGALLPPRYIDLSGSSGLGVRRLKSELRFEKVDDIKPWELSDDRFGFLLSWMFSEGLLGEPEAYSAPMQERLRRQLNLLRARHMMPCEWSSLPCSKQELACAQARLYKLKKKLLWSRFQPLLLKPD